MTKELFLEWLEFNVVSLEIFLLGATLFLLFLSSCRSVLHTQDLSALSSWITQGFTMVLKYLPSLIASVWLSMPKVPFLLIAQIYAGVRLEYLPPYSPDLNPIEEAFSKIKHFIRRNQDYFTDAEGGDGIFADMLDVLDIVEPEDAEGYFIHAGYF